MQKITNLFNHTPQEHYVGPATVSHVLKSAGDIEVCIPELYGEKILRARSAIGEKLAVQDRVLIIHDYVASVYIIGVLEKHSQAHSDMNTHELSDGARIVETGSDKPGTFQVYSSNNELLLEYDTKANVITVSAANADLCMKSADGDLRFEASNTLQMEADRIDIIGRSKIGLTLGQTYERLKSALTLFPGTFQVAAQKLDLVAKRSAINIEEIQTRAKRIDNRAERLQMIVGQLDVAARTLIEKTKSSYRKSEGLSQWRSGRVRMLIDKAFQLKSRNTVMKSDTDVKIRADKIHLG